MSFEKKPKHSSQEFLQKIIILSHCINSLQIWGFVLNSSFVASSKKYFCILCCIVGDSFDQREPNTWNIYFFLHCIMWIREWFDMVLMILSVGNTATIHVALAVVDNILSPYYLPCAICKYSTRMMFGEKERILYWF